MKNHNLRLTAILFMIFSLSLMGALLHLGFGVNIPWSVITIPIWGPFALITVALFFVGWIHFMTLAFRRATKLILLTKTTIKKNNVNMIHPTIKTEEDKWRTTYFDRSKIKTKGGN